MLNEHFWLNRQRLLFFSLFCQNASYKQVQIEISAHWCKYSKSYYIPGFPETKFTSKVHWSKCAFQHKYFRLTTGKKLSQIDFVLMLFQASLSPSAPDTLIVRVFWGAACAAKRKKHTNCRRLLWIWGRGLLKSIS